MSLFGNLSTKQFLRAHWQKKPLLIRQALPDFVSPISAEELAGLACEDEIESRIITTTDDTDCPWQLRNGPFNENDFTSLSDKDWTLLIQDCQRYSDDVAALLKHFDFMPRWRLDDIMISYATTGGSVGPHVDQYDVFLIQAEGERRWQINTTTTAENNLYPDCELDILQSFNADDEWVLSPGDMLYLPPKLAHYGVAVNNCITISIGFRAPGHQEMMASYLEALLQHENSQERFSDPHRGVPENTAEIEAQDIEQFSEFLKTQLNNTSVIADVFGRLVTEPKHTDWFDVTDRSKADIIQNGIQLDPDARISFFRERYYHNRLFANGESLDVAPPAARLIPRLCETGRLDASEYQDIIDSDEFNQLVDFLIEHALIAHDD